MLNIGQIRYFDPSGYYYVGFTNNFEVTL
jgi:hypothetical protein